MAKAAQQLRSGMRTVAPADVPQPDTRRAQVLAEIERQSGQTKFGLQARLKLSSGQTDRALRQLVAASLVGLVRDERGRGRYVSLRQWLDGTDLPGACRD